MAAFSDRMLVWKATSSITATTSVTRCEASIICCIAATVSRMASLPCSAWDDRRWVSSSSRWAASALRATSVLSWLMAATELRSVVACSSVRLARRELPSDTSCPVWSTMEALLRISATRLDRRWPMRSSTWPMSASSSRPSTVTLRERSPWAMASVCLCRARRAPRKVSAKDNSR